MCQYVLSDFLCTSNVVKEIRQKMPFCSLELLSFFVLFFLQTGIVTAFHESLQMSSIRTTDDFKFVFVPHKLYNSYVYKIKGLH